MNMNKIDLLLRNINTVEFLLRRLAILPEAIAALTDVSTLRKVKLSGELTHTVQYNKATDQTMGLLSLSLNVEKSIGSARDFLEYLVESDIKGFEIDPLLGWSGEWLIGGIGQMYNQGNVGTYLLFFLYREK